jgi:hypothetical protein
MPEVPTVIEDRCEHVVAAAHVLEDVVEKVDGVRALVEVMVRVDDRQRRLERRFAISREPVPSKRIEFVPVRHVRFLVQVSDRSWRPRVPPTGKFASRGGVDHVAPRC